MKDQNNSKLSKFQFNGSRQKVRFTETLNVAVGVECDIYTFVDDKSKDLGIIRIKSGCKTPLQRVLSGDKTIEGYISGRGTLTITKANGKKEICKVGNNKKEKLEMNVTVGELMQWQADNDSELIAYEICFPPYKEGRYENIKEEHY